MEFSIKLDNSKVELTMSGSSMLTTVVFIGKRDPDHERYPVLVVRLPSYR